MSTITISSRGHSCMQLEREDATLVIDPGLFSDPTAAEGAAAVLITHEHADHVAPDRVIAALRANLELQVWAPQDVVTQLTGAGASADQLHVATGGDSFQAAGFQVQAFGDRHATIHPALPPVSNVAYLIEGLALHPGDSFTPVPEGAQVEVVFLPISAPWLKLAEAADYLGQVGAAIAVPIHDAILSDPGKMHADRIMGALAGDAQYRRLAPGETLTVTAN
jgi:L-ascorbate metabolism protein UlaG (beta-lactamase superfamily)